MCAMSIYGRQKPGRDSAILAANGNGKSASGLPLIAAAVNALPESIAIVDAEGFIVAVNDTWRRYADENGMRWPRYGIGYSYLAALDKAAEREPHVAEIAAGIRQVLVGAMRSHRIEYPCEMPGGCHFAQQVTAFDYAGARHAVVAHENITPRKMGESELRAALEAAEAELHEEKARRQAAEHRVQVAEATANLLAIASSGQPLADVLEGMAERIREALGSDATGIYRAEEHWDRPVLVAAAGPAPGGPAPGGSAKRRSALPAPILARALQDRRGACAFDVTQEPSLPAAKTGGPARRAAHRALLVTPIRRKDAPYGYLVQFHAQPRQFGADEIDLAHQFAEQISLALENAELRSRGEQIAVEAERSRLARELHDAVTQTLFSATVVAEALPRVWDRDPEQGRHALADLRAWTRGALAEMRALLMELRPAAMIEKPLPDLLRQLGEAAATRLLISVDCDVAAEVEPPAEVKLSLYRISQEALNNMIKHAGASHVEIRYRGDAQGVELSIVDDGRGFEVDGPSTGQMGLSIMHERARHIGARLAIESAPGAGTEVRVEWRPRRRKNGNG